MSKKICILIPYYGKWPVYFNLFLDTCKNNPLLNVIFITDLEPREASKNVIFHSLTKEGIKDRIKSHFGVEASLDQSYKLCDIRPAYGIIFSDLITDYDYWGWGDIDLVYGKMEHFFENDSFSEYDIISGRKLWVSGAFCLIRNSEKINRLFMINEDYLNVFKSDKHTSFGECGKRWQDLVDGQSIFDIDFEQSNFTLIVREAEREGKVKVYFENLHKESIGKSKFLKMSKGCLTEEDGKELFLFHYITDKKKGIFRYPNWNQIPSEYFITQTGFHTQKEFNSLFFSARESLVRGKRKMQYLLQRIKNKLR